MSVINEVEDLPGFIVVWLHSDIIANALSLVQGDKAKKNYYIEYYSKQTNVFKVTTVCGHLQHFIPWSKGLVCDADFSRDFNYVASGTCHIQCMDSTYAHDCTAIGITNVESNKSKFSKQDVLQVEVVWKLQHITCHLSY